MLLRPIGFGSHVVGCCLWGGVLCENCIVDANAIIINGNGNNDCCCLFFLFCGFVLGIFCCLCVKNCVFCFRAHGGCLGMLSR